MTLKNIALAGALGLGLIACTAEQKPAEPSKPADPVSNQPAANTTTAKLELDREP